MLNIAGDFSISRWNPFAYLQWPCSRQW